VGPADPSLAAAQGDLQLRESLKHDFSGAYMAVGLRLLQAEQRPETLTPDTVAALTELLLDPRRFASARQRFFLLKQAALTLATVYTAKPARAQAASLAHQGLRQALTTGQGPALRAAAWALGSLPVNVPSLRLAEPLVEPASKPPRWDCQALLELAGIGKAARPYFMGRTLILPCSSSDALVAVKLARSAADAPLLAREAYWLRHLADRPELKPADAHIPKLLAVNGGSLFRLRQLPIAPNGKGSLHPGLLAFAFRTRSDYFSYPNDTRPDHRPTSTALLSIMARNARQMGLLTGSGILHTAPIPLFHNRIQRHRRDDQGRYQWYRSGRLDRWLTSCTFPNMGVSGLRDFEHLVPHSGNSLALFREIGSHFLSLLLVAGAYFRNADPARVGYDPWGGPVDARDLFDRHLLERLVRTIFSNYYQGFTGREAKPSPCPDIERLCERMIAEMGRDRYMVETLRSVDQKEMDLENFLSFLREGGMSEEEIAQQKKGACDIELASGPHLGNFNRQISLPELTDAVGVMAAICMDGRYVLERVQ
jgi:hypothetical protein